MLSTSGGAFQEVLETIDHSGLIKLLADSDCRLISISEQLLSFVTSLINASSLRHIPFRRDRSAIHAADWYLLCMCLSPAKCHTRESKLTIREENKWRPNNVSENATKTVSIAGRPQMEPTEILRPRLRHSTLSNETILSVTFCQYTAKRVRWPEHIGWSFVIWTLFCDKNCIFDIVCICISIHLNVDSFSDMA